MWMNGSSSFRSTPANARLTGNPRPSRADGALVIDTTGRCMPFGGSAGTGGSTVRSGTVKAGTADSLGRFVFNDPWETPTADNTFPDSCPADRHTASGGFDHRDGVALVDHVALVDRHLGDDTGDLGRHGDLHLHGLQDHERVVGLNDVPGTGHDLPDAGDHFRHDHVAHACSFVPSRARGPRDLSRASGTTGNQGACMSHVVMAEMVASVWKVVASAGDIVEPNDTLVILESMKMEIPVPAEVAGVITEMTVNEGDVVNEGDSIAVIEPS